MKLLGNLGKAGIFENGKKNKSIERTPSNNCRNAVSKKIGTNINGNFKDEKTVFHTSACVRSYKSL